MADVTAWLNDHGFGRSYEEGPTRGIALPQENLEPGDCRDDGAIIGSHGQPVFAGQIWVTMDKAWNAGYYGWKRSDPKMTSVMANGTVLYVVEKDVSYDL